MSAPGRLWGAGSYERLAERLAPIHDELVERLASAPGERWLDVATGPGAVALRAARAGAEVTGLDIAPRLLAEARAAAEREGLTITWDEGDAQSLPYADGSFDVVSSSLGVIFAPDQAAVARELARVTRTGGRLGLATWRPNPTLVALTRPFAPGPPPADVEAWGDDVRVEELLGDAFDLELHEGEWRLEGDSPEDVYEFMADAAPPLTALRGATADPEGLRRAHVEYWSRFRDGDGRVSEPRRYLLVIGRRK